MNPTLGLSLASILAATAIAQDGVRPTTQLSSGTVTTSIAGYDAWRIVAPRIALPADSARQLAMTSRVVYAFWLEQDGSGNDIIRFLKSDDGGWSWNTANAVTIWTNDNANGEDLDVGGEMNVYAGGHDVYITFTSTRDGAGNPNPPGGTGPGFNDGKDRCWVVGSNDQGATWSSVMVSTGCDGTLSTGDQLGDVDEIRAAAAGNDVLHVVFEADYRFAAGMGRAVTDENIYYNAVGFLGGRLALIHPEEIRVDNTSGPSGDVDEDFPAIAADGNVVAIAWQDDRIVSANGAGGNNAANNCYIKVSTMSGSDFATIPETNLTNFTSTVGFAPRAHVVEVIGNEVYVSCEDSRNLVDDDLWLNYSTDAGQTWTTGILASRSPVGVDSDGQLFLVDANHHLAIAYRDDRQAPGNVDNDIFVVSGTLADFVAGTQVEQLVFDTPGSDTVLYRAAEANGVFAFGCELSAFPEDSGTIYSADHGATWEVAYNTVNMVADTDDVDVAVTLNGDIVSIWQDDQNQGNGANNVYVRGIKVPTLVDRTASNQGIRLLHASPDRAGDLAVLFPALAIPTSNGFALDLVNGPILNFSADALTVAAVGNLFAFVAPVDAQGSATWAFPNFATLIGQPIHWAAQVVEVPGGALTVFSDPLRQDP